LATIAVNAESTAPTGQYIHPCADLNPSFAGARKFDSTAPGDLGTCRNPASGPAVRAGHHWHPSRRVRKRSNYRSSVNNSPACASPFIRPAD